MMTLVPGSAFDNSVRDKTLAIHVSGTKYVYDLGINEVH